MSPSNCPVSHELDETRIHELETVESPESDRGSEIRPFERKRYINPMLIFESLYRTDAESWIHETRQ
jgi:hypothetical protein